MRTMLRMLSLCIKKRLNLSGTPFIPMTLLTSKVSSLVKDAKIGRSFDVERWPIEKAPS